MPSHFRQERIGIGIGRRRFRFRLFPATRLCIIIIVVAFWIRDEFIIAAFFFLCQNDIFFLFVIVVVLFRPGILLLIIIIIHDETIIILLGGFLLFVFGHCLFRFVVASSFFGGWSSLLHRGGLVAGNSLIVATDLFRRQPAVVGHFFQKDCKNRKKSSLGKVKLKLKLREDRVMVCR